MLGPKKILLTLLAISIAGTLFAQCTTSGEIFAVKRTIRKTNKCNNKIFENGSNSGCIPPAPPVCSGTLSTDVVALSFGVNNPPASAIDTEALAAQFACQDQITTATFKYIWKKYDAMINDGKTEEQAEQKARKQLDKIPNLCTNVTVAQDTSGVIIPSVGPQCAAAVGNPGDLVDAVKLRDCLHTLVQVWYDNRYGPSPQPLRPNMILILSDDQRWDTTDSKHSPFGTDIMPSLRAELGGAGLELDQAFMTTPLCCPSRSSILRGQYAHTTGVYGNAPPNGGAVDFDDTSSIGTWLQASGYHTMFLGKYLNGYTMLWDETMGELPYVPPGWNDWQAFEQVKYYDYNILEGTNKVYYGNTEADYSTDVLRTRAVSLINSAAQLGQPFFLYLAPKAPHGPWEPAPRHIGMFASATPWRPPSHNEEDVSDKPLWLQGVPLLTDVDIAEIDAIRIAQLEMVQAVDELVAAVMQAVRDNHIEQNTMVVYFADNGWSWGEHRRRAKNIPYEEAIRSPMFVYYPKLAPLPRIDSRFALNIDLSPTFAELAGATPTIPVDGQSLVRVFDNTAASWRTDFMTEGYANNREWATVRESMWKYTEYVDGEQELYNLEDDPYELNNVAYLPENAQCVQDMAARLREIRPGWPDDVSIGDDSEDEGWAD
ncbi:sulfatase [bacterium]|nr:sulfatase [bacterium]